MNNFYTNMVACVGELILGGIWYSDACEIVFTVSDPSKHMNLPLPRSIESNEWWDRFECDVNTYTHHSTREVPLPKYKPIF